VNDATSTYEGVGTVDKILGNNNYMILVGEGEAAKTVLCHLSGKMRRFRINVIPGDEVTVEIPAPFEKGRITFRGRKEDRPARNTGGDGPKKKDNKKRAKGRGGRR
jgi:translation initiation factor IF-1